MATANGSTAMLRKASMTLAAVLDTYAMHSLSQRERRYILYRQLDVYDFGTNEMTYRAIAKIEGITVERIMQIAHKAKRKIEHALHLAGERMKDPHIIVKHVEKEEPTPNLPMRQKWLYDLGPLSVRTWNCLHNADLLLLDRLLDKHPPELLMQPNFGRNSLREVEQLLELHELKLRDYSIHGQTSGQAA